jgi:hypothetical protein
VDSLAEPPHGEIGRLGRSLRIARVDEDRLAAGPPPRLDVAPAIADHDAVLEVDSPVVCGVEEEAGRGLAALAAIGVVVGAYADLVEG